MNRPVKDIEHDLSRVSNILQGCNEKLLVLKVCNDYAILGGGVPELQETGDAEAVFGGLSRITYEIVEQISEALSLVEDVERNVGRLGETAKEATA